METSHSRKESEGVQSYGRFFFHYREEEDINLLKDLFENENVNEFVRGQALRALVLLVLHNKLDRNEILGYLEQKLKQEINDPDFAKRMFQYFYRIFDLYDKKIYAITIFTDDLGERHMPNTYEYDFYGTTLSYSFNTYKVTEQDEEELLKSLNPFSYIILAAKKSLVAKKSSDEIKYELKKQLLNILSQVKEKNKLSNKYVAALLLFMDNIIKLSNDLEIKFRENELKNWEGGLMITYEDEMKNRFKKEGKMEVAKNLIRLGVSHEKIKKATSLPDEILDELIKEAEKKKTI